MIVVLVIRYGQPELLLQRVSRVHLHGRGTGHHRLALGGECGCSRGRCRRRHTGLGAIERLPQQRRPGLPASGELLSGLQLGFGMYELVVRSRCVRFHEKRALRPLPPLGERGRSEAPARAALCCSERRYVLRVQ